MAAFSYTVRLVDGVKPSSRRAIAFLSCSGDSNIDAGVVFGGLKQKREREVRSRFDYWIDGSRADKWFHGWPNDADYKQCFVFKWKDKNQHHRLYGFLCNPQPITNPSFQLCVLVSHAMKTKWETDPHELDGANSLRANPAVKAAIAKLHPELKVGKNPWVI